ncbi:alpha/beta fold hydrolase [Edwardsiella anguillarum]|nr:alpha/beta fold hydrolase [Edwardsiella anguillarum]
MSALFWHTCGAGKRDLVLLHGWGLNAEVWRCIVPQLSAQFRLHLVDLPGYGRSGGDTPYSLAEMTQRVLAQAPERALWLGWSLGARRDSGGPASPAAGQRFNHRRLFALFYGADGVAGDPWRCAASFSITAA